MHSGYTDPFVEFSAHLVSAKTIDTIVECLIELSSVVKGVVHFSDVTAFRICMYNEKALSATVLLLEDADAGFSMKELPWNEFTSNPSFQTHQGIPLENRNQFFILNQKLGAQKLTHTVFCHSGWLQFNTTQPIQSESNQVIRQLSMSLDLVLARYDDLRQIEKLKQGVQIEASLQRIRNRTISMDKSEELSEVASIMFQNLGGLFDFSPHFTRLVIVITEEEQKINRVWSTNFTGQSMSSFRLLPLLEHPAQKEMYEAWKKDKAGYHSIFFKDKDAYDYIVYLVKQPGFDEDKELKEIIDLLEKNSPLIPKSFFLNMAFFSHGRVGMITIEKLEEDHIRILKQFARVFEQTYTRFLDLKKAESLALETRQQAVLDRVRGEIASMRNTEDLDRITPLIWRELKMLDVPFFRCGLFIMDEHKKNIQLFLSTPSGDHLARFFVPYDSPPPTKSVLDSWRKKEIHSLYWTREEFLNWSNKMLSLGMIESPDSLPLYYQSPDNLALYFVPFQQGMIYIGNHSPLTEEHLHIVQSLADTFQVAYARYEDFKIMESNNSELAKTLNYLERTQAQLIQSEKMASLGQLTTGIAHEIKNPLNFINNFSLLSLDMMEELAEWIQQTGGKHEQDIIKLIISNEKLIHQHGTRADNIVNSMTHHARRGSDERQPVSLSALLDEYISLLAQYGSEESGTVIKPVITREYDPHADTIELFQQQFGQVVINLLNNALDAMREKKIADQKYVPRLSITTARTENFVEIRITDNGPGIPRKYRDRVFEPFFTTKPLGKGTGLGLYLSYDIITKGHGGEFSVESQEDEGTSFIISLPA